MDKVRQGYMFYPKDWNFSASVQKLNLEQEAVYRKLIDKVMTEGQGIVYDSAYFKYYLKANANKVERIFKVLLEANVIEIEDNIITVPSCNVRLARSEAGSKGGKARAKKVADAKKEADLLEAKSQAKEIKENKTKQKETIVEEVSNYDWFIECWNKYLIEHTNAKEEGLTFLTKAQKDSISKLLNDGLEIDDIKKGIVGLMVQKLFPNNQNLRYPNHLLKNDGEFVQKYAIAFNTNNRELYGKVKRFE